MAGISESPSPETPQNYYTDRLLSLTTPIRSAWDRIVPSPERRSRLTELARTHPFLATLLVSQIAFAGPPLLLFAFFIVNVLAFSLLLAVIAAVSATVLCAGFALLILVPTLVVTMVIGFGVWLWAWTLYGIVRLVGESLNSGSSGVSLNVALSKGDSGQQVKRERN